MKLQHLLLEQNPPQYNPGDVFLHTPMGDWVVQGASAKPFWAQHSSNFLSLRLSNKQHGDLTCLLLIEDGIISLRDLTELTNKHDVQFVNQAVSPLLKVVEGRIDPNGWFVQIDKELVSWQQVAPKKLIFSTQWLYCYKLDHATDFKHYTILRHPVVPQGIIDSNSDVYMLLHPLHKWIEIVAVVQNQELVAWIGDSVSDTLNVIKKFIQHVPITHSGVSTLIDNGKSYVDKGQALPTDRLFSQNAVATLSDQTVVYELDAQSRKVIGAYNSGVSWNNADRILAIKNPGISRNNWLFFAIKNNKIMGMGPKNEKDVLIKVSHMLTQDPTLGLAGSGMGLVKPGGAFHEILSFVNDHPGCSRLSLYVDGLGRSSLYGAGDINSTKSLDGMAIRAGLITVTSGSRSQTYSFEMTPIGKLVLGRLNGGHPVNIHKLIKTDV